MTGKQYRLAGYVAAFTACLIGVGWQIATRAGVTTSGLAPVDLALLRYGLPGLVLLPVWYRVGLMPRGVPTGTTLIIVVGMGLPFGLLVMAGAQFAPISHMAAILPGAAPLLIGVLAAIILADKLSAGRLAGWAVIIIGISIMFYEAFADGGTEAWIGDMMFICAAMIWAVYTVAYRKSGLTPWQAAAVANGWSMVIVIPGWILLQDGGLMSLATETPVTLLVQILFQGVLAGLLGLWVYGFAVSRAGAVQTAAIGALVPALSAASGVLILGEAMGFSAIIGIVAVTIGVFLTVTAKTG